MLFILLYLGNGLAHFLNHGGLVLVVYVSLEEFEDVEPVAGVENERRAQNIQSIVDGDKVVPILDAAADRRLEGSKAFLAIVPRFGRLDDVPAGAANSRAGEQYVPPGFLQALFHKV